MDSDTFTISKLRDAYAKIASLGPSVPTLKFVTNIYMTVLYEDWSGVRSPSRAIRRRKQGHRQNIRYINIPDPKIIKMADGTCVGHPETIRRLEQAALADRAADKIRRLGEQYAFGADSFLQRVTFDA